MVRDVDRLYKDLEDLEEESQDLSSQVLSPGLLVVHDSAGRGENHKTKLSGGEQVVGPLLNVADTNVKSKQKVCQQ